MVSAEGRAYPRELLQSHRLAAWVLRLEPTASEELRLAAHSQHIRRWEVPRTTFPADRAGYHRWRNHLKRFHADLSGRILRECGYEAESIARVQALNLKANFPGDREAQVLEDALCLVFLEHQLMEVSDRMDREKVINALRKSWAKMSLRARVEALALKLPVSARALVDAALA